MITIITHSIAIRLALCAAIALGGLAPVQGTLSSDDAAGLLCVAAHEGSSLAVASMSLASVPLAIIALMQRAAAGDRGRRDSAPSRPENNNRPADAIYIQHDAGLSKARVSRADNSGGRGLSGSSLPLLIGCFQSAVPATVCAGVDNIGLLLGSHRARGDTAGAANVNTIFFRAENATRVFNPGRVFLSQGAL